MSYRDDLDALRTRHDELAKELTELRAERRRLEDVSERAAVLEEEVAELKKQLESMQSKRSLPILDDVRIASPCSEQWDEMIGDERSRFCLKCDKSVYDISAMTRDEALDLIAGAEKKDRLCLRLFRRQDGTILTADCPVGLRRRRVTRIAAAAAVFGGAAAALSYTASAAVMGEMEVPTVAVPTVEDPPGVELEPEPHPQMGAYVMGDYAEPAHQDPKPDEALETEPPAAR